MFLPAILLGTIALLLFFYQKGRYNESYWKKRGVKFHERNKVFGPFWDFFVGDRALFQIFGKIYEEYKNEPAVGFAAFSTPSLFLIDPKNIQHVLREDFQSFNHRGIEMMDDDQLADNILFMNGPRWKLMRKSMTPMFTSNKLKSMYYIMDKSAQDFVKYLKQNPKSCEGDLFDTLSMFCSAAICGAIFGIKTDSIFDSPFLNMARNLSLSNWKNGLKLTFADLFPKLANKMGIKMFKEHEKFFISAIEQVTKNREQENVKRHDFADMCISLQKNGTMKDATTGCELEPTFGLLSAQGMFFFIAGVEPCASTIFSTLFLLGQHPEILEKVQQEIDNAFEKHNENVSYDVISELQYTDKVLSESLRILPPIGHMTRQCVQDTVLPVGNIKVEKGTKMYTPVYQIHNDPKLYPEPEVFDPERFSKDRKPNDDMYLPFGMGNRLCIGARYAKLQVLAGLVHLLRHFSIKTVGGMKDIKFAKDIINVRLSSVDVKLIPREI